MKNLMKSLSMLFPVLLIMTACSSELQDAADLPTEPESNCYSCHGDAEAEVSYPVSYPAHPTHIEGGLTTATTIDCEDCHTVPESTTEPEHINGVVEVYFQNAMAEIVTKGREGDAMYNADGSCENMYCHGNFTNGNNRKVEWKGTDQAVCGSCHGDEATGDPLPKEPHTQSTGCTGCHADAYDENQNLIKTKHLDGLLQVFGQERDDW